VAFGYAVASVVVGFVASTVGIWAAAAHHRGSVR
jgi:ascorbate-specific PTS system EIIC-type component UlaA